MQEPVRETKGVNTGDRLIGSYKYVITIAGSRKYTDYAHFCNKIKVILSAFVGKDFCIVSGMASSGPDKMIVDYCDENKIGYFKYEAFWDYYGKKAGYIRNTDMANVSSHVFIFWDGMSKGSKHMIEICMSKEKIQAYIVPVKT